MNYVIRKREKKDCKELAHIVTVVWNETYRGIVPDSFLDSLILNEEERGNNSFKKFTDKDNHQYVLK